LFIQDNPLIENHVFGFGNLRCLGNVPGLNLTLQLCISRFQKLKGKVKVTRKILSNWKLWMTR